MQSCASNRAPISTPPAQSGCCNDSSAGRDDEDEDDEEEEDEEEEEEDEKVGEDDEESVGLGGADDAGDVVADECADACLRVPLTDGATH